MAVPALKYLHTNNASSNLAVPLTASSTSVQVSAGQGVLFPNPGAGQGAFITVEDRRIGRMEIVLCTGRVGDTLTVSRGQQGTVPLAFEVGSNVSNRVTAGVLDFFIDRVTAELDPTLLPLIPPEKLTTVPAAKLTGTIDNARIPVLLDSKLPATIPMANLTQVPAANLVIGGAAPGLIPVTVLPNIPVGKVTSVYAGNIILGPVAGQKISQGVIPNIPSSLLTAVPAANLQGEVPNGVLSGSYTNLVNIAGNRSTFNDFIAAVSLPSSPGYAFAGYGSSGMLYSTSLDAVVLARAAVSRLSIYATHIQIEPPYFLAGIGSGLTALNAANLTTGVVPVPALPTSGTERTRILDLMASTPFGGVGSYAMLKNISASNALPNENGSGANLRFSSADGSAPSNATPAGIWRCMGECPAGDTTLWLRLS